MPKRVLLIDYEPRSVDRVRSLLDASEYAVTMAKDGEEGLTTFAAGTFDVILLAGMLPRLPSAEVIREIRKKGGATAPPILLMVSGYHGTNPKADAQRVGAFDIVVKPYTDEAFRGALAAALEATDASARTMRISTAEILGKPSGLTSDDIFSEVLQDVGERASSMVHRPADPSTTETEVERRLKDTLAGIRAAKAAAVPGGGGAAASAGAGAASGPGAGAAGGAAAPARFSTDADIDRMISDTLSGLKTPPRTRAAVVDKTPPAGMIVPAPTPPAPAGAPGQAGSRATAPTVALSSTGATAGGHAGSGPVAVPMPPPAAMPPRPAPAPVTSSGPDRFGHYEILERIAAGGMAELSKARLSGAEGFQKILAIKKILPHLADNEEFIAMFADEAKLAAQLNHPNIVHIFDLGKIESGGYFIAMEYVDGRDLRTILQSAKELGTPLPPPLAVYIASKIAAALDYAHRRKDAEGRELTIVHRDVSPPNILISYEGDIKLCDFGIAKAASKASQTQSGALKGKVQYMSPEQAWGRPIDRRSDIFSLGCVLYEMLTEQKLFRGDTDLSVLEKVRAAQVSPPSAVNPEVPKSLDAVLMKALAREPDERYANASEMLRDLEAVLYSYSPAPGSADLAIYLHRLQAEESAIAESRAREAARSATPLQPEKKRKSKGTPVARRTTGSVPVPGAGAPGPSSGTGPGVARREPTAPGVYGAPPAARAAAEKKSRAPLYAMIGVAAVILAGGVYWIVTRQGTTAAPAPVRATPLPVAPAPTAAPAPPPAAAAPSVDPKVIEEEVQRQLAARRKELQKALEAPKPPRETATAPAAASAKKTEEAAPPPAAAAKPPETAPAKEKEPEPAATSATAAPKESAPEPTAVPVRAAPVIPAPSREEVSRGDLIGPGAGVVEPVLVSTPRVNYPPIARQQRVTGRVIVLVLVGEEGAVLEARLQQGVPPRYGVNEAVVEAVRTSKFKAATKNGTPVKMWRTVVVEVKP